MPVPNHEMITQGEIYSSKWKCVFFSFDEIPPAPPPPHASILAAICFLPPFGHSWCNHRALVHELNQHVFCIQNILKYRSNPLIGIFILFIENLQFLHYLHNSNRSFFSLHFWRKQYTGYKSAEWKNELFCSFRTIHWGLPK